MAAACSGVLEPGAESGKNCVRFVFEMGLDIQLDIQLGTPWHICNYPFKVKKNAKIGIFEPLTPPFNPKFAPLNNPVKIV